MTVQVSLGVADAGSRRRLPATRSVQPNGRTRVAARRSRRRTRPTVCGAIAVGTQYLRRLDRLLRRSRLSSTREKQRDTAQQRAIVRRLSISYVPRHIVSASDALHTSRCGTTPRNGRCRGAGRLWRSRHAAGPERTTAVVAKAQELAANLVQQRLSAMTLFELYYGVASVAVDDQPWRAWRGHGAGRAND